ncbi:MAG: FG-GAP repeat protein [Chloroflexi bacterium]|nr:FG-GAP repeat protein [Chloroflexota bacterium]
MVPIPDVITPYDGQPGDFFGAAVDLTSYGFYLLIGAKQDTTGALTDTGSVYHYKLTGLGDGYAVQGKYIGAGKPKEDLNKRLVCAVSTEPVFDNAVLLEGRVHRLALFRRHRSRRLVRSCRGQSTSATAKSGAPHSEMRPPWNTMLVALRRRLYPRRHVRGVVDALRQESTPSRFSPVWITTPRNLPTPRWGHVPFFAPRIYGKTGD